LSTKATSRPRGRPPFGPELLCTICNKKRTRWLKHAGRATAVCKKCYDRESYEPSRRKLLPRTEEPQYDPKIARRAATLLRKGADWRYVCDATGVSQRSLLIWMGRLAATEAF
jgi:hypothetical protein